MKNQTQKVLGTTLSAILILFVLSSCETWREECTGEIIVENEIPDTTLYIGGEPFIRDISEPPKVFGHTDGKKEITLKNVMADDNDIALAGTRINEDGKRNIIYIEARNAGNTQIRVTAEYECFDYIKSTYFNITVLDTTTS